MARRRRRKDVSVTFQLPQLHDRPTAPSRAGLRWRFSPASQQSQTLCAGLNQKTTSRSGSSAESRLRRYEQRFLGHSRHAYAVLKKQ